MLTFIVACIIIGLFVLSYAAESHDDGYSDNGKPYKKPKTDIRRKNKQDVVPLYRKGNKQKATVPTYKIRQPQEKIPIKKLKPTIILDDKKLEDLKHQTQIAQQLLSDIFIEEETQMPVNETGNNVMEVLKELLKKDTWQREEVQNLFGSGVMIGNMLEQINDYAYSKVEDIVVEEDGDTIYVTTEYKEQLI